MKKFLIIFIITVFLFLTCICIGVILSKRMLTIEETNAIINTIEKDSNNVTTSTSSTENSKQKYYLHKINLKEPSKEACEKAQLQALSGLEKSEITEVQKTFRNAHMLMERLLVEAVRPDFVQSDLYLKNPDSPYWKSFTIDEIFEDPLSGVKVDSPGFYNVGYYLENLESIIKDLRTKNKILTLYNELQVAMKSHDLAGCFKVHETLHDYDYWIINYPPSLDSPPADWSGIHTYFGTIDK